MTTFAPDTPMHVLSDYAEERCHELGLPCVRDDNGLTVTVPAKPDGLPDWETFLRVCHELRAADGWVMEGAEPWLNNAWCNKDYFSGTRTTHTPDEVPLGIYQLLFGQKNGDNSMVFYHYPETAYIYTYLSRACVAYSRSGGAE